MRKKENGSVTIEAVISLVIFLIFFITIISVINYVRAQMFISNMVNEVSRELSQYSYLYSISGLEALDKSLGENDESDAIIEVIDNFNLLTSSVKDINNEVNNLSDGSTDAILDNKVLEQVEDIINKSSDVYTESGNLASQIEELVSNPSGLLKSFIVLAGQKTSEVIKSYLTEIIAKSLSKKYLLASDEDLYKHLGMVNDDSKVNISFKGSQIFSSNYPDDIIIKVSYRIKLIQLLNINTEIILVDSTKAKAWLNGDGE